MFSWSPGVYERVALRTGFNFSFKIPERTNLEIVF